MKLKKHSMTVRGHRTSVSLEDIFWVQLHVLAKKEKKTLQEMIEIIDNGRDGNLCSAIRVYVVDALLKDK